jgi:uncharacterized protein YecE (DUF72 family)
LGILVGTASWAEKTLIDSKRFYPADVKSAEDRLRYYAQRFALVEIDASYYALPTAQNAERWAERTPEGFTFNVKAFRLFTGHQTPYATLDRDIREQLGEPEKPNVYLSELPPSVADELWRRFALGLAPLQKAGKLGCVLFQFAPWFVISRKSFAHIELCMHKLPGMRLAVEFRNRSWFDQGRAQDVLAFEREHGFSHVVVDEPQGFSSSIPAIWETTSDLAVIRLHGRNRETWNKRGLGSAAERFDYLYDETELEELGERILQFSTQAPRTHVVFNNSHRDYSQRNALWLLEWLKGRDGKSRDA